MGHEVKNSMLQMWYLNKEKNHITKKSYYNNNIFEKTSNLAYFWQSFFLLFF